MANKEHLAILMQGVKVWNEWRENNADARPDLRRADLRRADLQEAHLRRADLQGADLRRADLRRADLLEASLNGADLSEADLSYAILSGAILSGAYLRRADLRRADLRRTDLRRADLLEAHLSEVDLLGADLSEADLSHATFSGATLRRADLNQAKLGHTMFVDVDLSGIKGLETVNHWGPSSIGIDTIYRSQGKIPEVFLRGAGIPDSFITYMHSLTGEAIQYYTCFISYSTKDQDFATRLHADLQAKGVRCWFAPEDIAGGKKIHEQIDQAIRLYDKLLVVLSGHSMASEWVKTEIYHARQQEMEENRRKLFPISLAAFDAIRQWKAFDGDLGKDMAREVREYFIPDFSQWEQHSHYQKAFDRLLRDLKAEA